MFPASVHEYARAWSLLALPPFSSPDDGLVLFRKMVYPRRHRRRSTIWASFKGCQESGQKVGERLFPFYFAFWEAMSTALDGHR